MRYSKNLSIIYDAIMYGVLYFNEDKHYNDVKNHGYDTDIAFEYYKKVKGKLDIPNIFQPLYYAKPGELTFLTNYLMIRYDYKKNNYLELLTDKDQIYHCLVKHYFHSDDADPVIADIQNPILLCNYIETLSVPAQVKMNLSVLLNSFHSVITEFVTFFQACYDMAFKLHSDNGSIIKKLRSETKTETSSNLLANILGNSVFDLSIKPYGISLLNSFMFLWCNEKVILGSHYMNVLADWDNYNHSTMESYCDIFENEVMYKIYDILCNQKEANATEISNQIGKPINTISKYLYHLFWLRAINISKMTSNGIYYTLNTDYLNYGQTIRATYLEYTKKASVESFAKLAANDIRYTAIEKLIEHGKLTSTQLGRMTKTSDAAMHKNLKILLNEGIIEIGEKMAKEIYYIINKEYLKHLKTNMEDKAVYFGQIAMK